MLGPTTWPVVNLGSSTVNADASRIAATAASRESTNQPSIASTQTTSPAARS